MPAGKALSFVFNDDGTKIRVAIRMVVLCVTGFIADLTANQVVSIQLALEAVVALFVTVIPPTPPTPEA